MAYARPPVTPLLHHSNTPLCPLSHCSSLALAVRSDSIRVYDGHSGGSERIPVQVTLLRSTVSADERVQTQYLTSYLINRTVAIDAGCIGFVGEPQDQAAIKHILLSHTHLDHIASLPIFVENAYEAKRDCVTVYASSDVLDCLQRDIFNNRVWPDFIALSPKDAPFLKLSQLEPGVTVEVAGLQITPIAVNHVVPTLGFIVADEDSAVIIVSDTGPTEEIWKAANKVRNLKAVFVEVTFPNSMTRIADLSKHLTPSMLAAEAGKLDRPVPLITVHLKARYQSEIVQELAALNLPQLTLVEFGKEYEF